MTKRIRVLHVINNLATGGAEAMLVRLALALRDDFDQHVVCILDRGPLAERLAGSGITVEALGVSPRLPNPLAIPRLARRVRAYEPHVVQTWLYQADFLGGLAARLAGIRNVIWNLRGADLSPQEAHPLTRVIVRGAAALSARLPIRIVCCGESVRLEHERIGYEAGRMVVIPNGVNVEQFRPDPAARPAVRSDLRLQPDTPLVGLFARLHPQKDHDTFFAAVALFRRERPDVHFVLAGSGMRRDEPRAAAMLRKHSIVEGVHLLGERNDLPRLTAALDLATSSSAWGEGFPNVIAEAMACAVPCAATDCGDSRIIVGETGRIVARRDAPALAAAWLHMLALDPAARRRLGALARDRIERQFDLRQSADRYASLYREVAGAD
jgi:glycosyltransferase involved in cell wall biosynthesis